MAKQAPVPKRDQNLFNNDGPSFCKPRTEPLEVLMVGLSRTGTSSMLEAMTTLGYGDIYNSRVMVRRHQAPFLGSIIRSKLSGTGPKYGIEQFESVLGESRCVSGEFPAVMAEELIAAYPDAKVILTVRSDEERWLHSIRDTMWYGYSTWSHWFLRKVDRLWSEQNAFLDPFWNLFFAGDPVAHGLRVYREHNALVKRVVEPKERLLVYDVKEGWGPLCAFLGKEVPEEPFPWVNTVEDHRKLFGGGRQKSMRAWYWRMGLGVGLPAAVVLGALWRRRLPQVQRVLQDVLRVIRP